MHRDTTRAARGFTLIELMIVVTVVGILAATAVPIYLNYAAKAQFAEATSLASGAETAVADAYAAHNTLNGLDNGVDSIPDAAEMSGTYVERVDVANGVITATFGADSALAGDTVTLTPHPAGGAISCRCSTSVPAALSPSSCR